MIIVKVERIDETRIAIYEVRHKKRPIYVMEVEISWKYHCCDKCCFCDNCKKFCIFYEFSEKVQEFIRIEYKRNKQFNLIPLNYYKIKE